MVSILALWLPILLSAVAVFIVSSIIHMFLQWHKGEYPKLANEDQVIDALRPVNLKPGDYMVPRAASMEDMKSEAFAEKMKKGPVIIMTVLPNGAPSMSGNLIQWFLYSLLIGVFAAYVAGRALTGDATYLQVFRFVGVTAFLGYSAALWQMSIWYKRSWTTTIMATIDGFIYALVTAGVFGWLWP
ncbi:hypothetical protein JNM05_02095 [bacterium]|nr:hypothetical protein [bacterium]